MANTWPVSRREGVLDDIDDWMASRQADVDQVGAAEAAGRDAWDQATRSGRNLPAAQPGDVVALGGKALRDRNDGPGPLPSKDAEQPLEIAPPIEAAARPQVETLRPMDLGFRVVQARPGDSISRMLGTSDPGGIGRFQSLNGLEGRNSSIRSGRNYFVPTQWDDTTAEEAAAGRRTLLSDNAKLAETAERKAEARRQAQLVAGDRKDIGDHSATPVEGFTTKFDTKRLDQSKISKGLGGTLAYSAGLAPGVVRGGWHTLEGLGDAMVFSGRLLNPLDPFLSADGDAAWDRVRGAGRSAVDLTRRYYEDPSRVRDDVARASSGLRRKVDPTATPMASSFRGELSRDVKLGMNAGELGWDVGSTLLGGEALRGAAGFGRVARAADATELAYLAKNPELAAYFDEPYSGMGHHIWGRNQALPSFFGGGPAPKQFVESGFNKIRDTGMTRRDFFRNHVGVDDDYWGGYMGRRFGRSGWSAKELGWGNYGLRDRLEFGTSPATKTVVGAGLLGGDSAEQMRKWGTL